MRYYILRRIAIHLALVNLAIGLGRADHGTQHKKRRVLDLPLVGTRAPGDQGAGASSPDASCRSEGTPRRLLLLICALQGRIGEAAQDCHEAPADRAPAAAQQRARQRAQPTDRQGVVLLHLLLRLTEALLGSAEEIVQQVAEATSRRRCLPLTSPAETLEDLAEGAARRAQAATTQRRIEPARRRRRGLGVHHFAQELHGVEHAIPPLL